MKKIWTGGRRVSFRSVLLVLIGGCLVVTCGCYQEALAAPAAPQPAAFMASTDDLDTGRENDGIMSANDSRRLTILARDSYKSGRITDEDLSWAILLFRGKYPVGGSWLQKLRRRMSGGTDEERNQLRRMDVIYALTSVRSFTPSQKDTYLSVLVSCTASSNSDERYAGLIGLGYLKDKRALPIISRLTRDPNTKVAKAANRSLSRFASHFATPTSK